MTNAERYMAAFNAIEGRLRDETQEATGVPFSMLVRLSKSPVVRRYMDDLREYAELRNAIVHARSPKLLAEPTLEVTTDIEDLATRLTAPPGLQSVIGGRVVKITRPDAPVREPLVTMRQGDLSQMPVYAGDSFVALLTAGTVSRWIADRLTQDGGILDDSPVSEVLKHTENDRNHSFLARDATVYDALGEFDRFRDAGLTLDAIIVSEGRRRDAKPLNIVTIFDVPALVKAS